MSDVARILVVDDSPFMRGAIQRMLATLPEIGEIQTTATGEEAVQLARSLLPDVIILDINLPGMNGLEALRRIMEEAPTAVLVMSAEAKEGAEVTVRALELGALDFIDKTSAGSTMEIHHLAPALREKVLAALGAHISAQPRPALEPPPPPAGTGRASGRSAEFRLVVIGASTGGPQALFELLRALPSDLPAGIVVAQHMPPGFTATLADRLDRHCALHIREACNGDPVRPGTVLVAPGGMETIIVGGAAGPKVSVRRAQRDILHRPSVDALFASAAEVCGPRAVGVVLTGMGSDGAEGLRRMLEAGGRTLVQSPESAVIDGMPRSAAPAAERILPLDEIATALVALFETHPTRPGSE